MLASGVTSGTVITKNGQTALMRERDKVSTAARLALMILVTEGAIAAIQLSPHLAMRHAHGQLEVFEGLLPHLVFIEGLPP